MHYLQNNLQPCTLLVQTRKWKNILKLLQHSLTPLRLKITVMWYVVFCCGVWSVLCFVCCALCVVRCDVCNVMHALCYIVCVLWYVLCGVCCVLGCVT